MGLAVLFAFLAAILVAVAASNPAATYNYGVATLFGLLAILAAVDGIGTHITRSLELHVNSLDKG